MTKITVTKNLIAGLKFPVKPVPVSSSFYRYIIKIINFEIVVIMGFIDEVISLQDMVHSRDNRIIVNMTIDTINKVITRDIISMSYSTHLIIRHRTKQMNKPCHGWPLDCQCCRYTKISFWKKRRNQINLLSNLHDLG